MSKRAQKKKRAELEALLTDRYEALGEVVLGMHGQGDWDDQILARGAAEVREVISELGALDLDQGADSSPVDRDSTDRGDRVDVTGTGATEIGGSGEPDSRADHLLAETAEHRLEEDGEISADARAEETSEVVDAPTGSSEVPGSESEPTETGEADRGSKSTDQESDFRMEELAQGMAEAGSGEGTALPVAPDPDPDHEEGNGTAEEIGEDSSDRDETRAPEDGVGSPETQVQAAEPSAEIEAMAAQIDESERQAKVASEAARAALQADSKTELSAITRAIEDERTSLDRTLEVAAKRIHAAEREAENAKAKLTRELASNREAAASWVRNQAEEIEADAALAQEMASASFEGDEGGGLGGDAGEARLQAMETEITSLKANLEAEKASKAEALAKAEVRVREIEAAAREAERKVDEARKWAPEEARLEERRGQEAELREAAVIWLREQVAAVRQEDAGGQQPDGPTSGEASD